MPDISLLPENLRDKESQEVSTKKPAPQEEPGALKMHVPAAAADEDVEIIEVDESELGVVLAGEPLLTRLTYQISAAIDSLKEKFFKKEEEAPPKLPPQFFTPPKPGLVTKSGVPTVPVPGAPAGAPSAAGAGVQLSKLTPGAPARPKARITPETEVPKRVRVIKRVRKQVRVSLIPAEELALLSVDTGRRAWTLVVLTLLFGAILGGGYVLLESRVRDAQATLAGVEKEVETTRAENRKKQEQWTLYQDLQPRMALLNSVLKNHVVITRLLDFLEMRTLPDVSYRSASLTPDGKLTLDVKASSFASAARQLVAFERSPIVHQADATTFSAEQDGTTGKIRQVSFQMLLSLDTAALRGPLLAVDGGRVPAAGMPSSAATSTAP